MNEHQAPAATAPIPNPAADPFLDTTTGDPHGNPLDTVDPAWGLPAADRIRIHRERGAA